MHTSSAFGDSSDNRVLTVISFVIYLYNICILSETLKSLLCAEKQVENVEKWYSGALFCSQCKYVFLTTMFGYSVYPAMSKGPNSKIKLCRKHGSKSRIIRFPGAMLPTLCTIYFCSPYFVIVRPTTMTS